MDNGISLYHLGRLELKEDNIECLLSTACLLQLSQVVEACCKFLMKQLHPSNCLGIRSFADAQGCTDLHKVAHNYTMVCISWDAEGHVLLTSSFLVADLPTWCSFPLALPHILRFRFTVYCVILSWSYKGKHQVLFLLDMWVKPEVITVAKKQSSGLGLF